MNDYFLFKKNLIVVNYDEMGKKEEVKEKEEKKKEDILAVKIQAFPYAFSPYVCFTLIILF